MVRDSFTPSGNPLDLVKFIGDADNSASITAPKLVWCSRRIPYVVNQDLRLLGEITEGSTTW